MMKNIEINNPTQPSHPIECEAPNDQLTKESLVISNLKYLVLGILFGIVFVKAEVISWYRIQEMFRLHSFHMYGVIGTAVVVGMISVRLIKQFKVKTVQTRQSYSMKRNSIGEMFLAH